MDANDQLRKYVTEGSEEAFRALVGRYAGLIYSAARRQIRDPHLAEDVTQAVFIILAQKAGNIPLDRPLGAWLLRTTANVSANARRQRAQREFHERKAAEMFRFNQNERADAPSECKWSELSPILDDAVDRLARSDREALVMRYFERMSLVEVGAALGITEAAAAKRVSRAVQRLRKRLSGQSPELSTASLAAMLFNNTLMPMPTDLVATLNSAVAPVASAMSMAKGALIVTTSTKLKVAAAAAILLLGGSVATIVALVPSRQPAGVAGNGLVSPATLPVPQLTESSFATVRFADGTGVSLVGIAQAHGASQTWWGYDGMPVPAPNFTHVRTLIAPNLDPTSRAMEIILQIEGQNIDKKTFSIFPVPKQGFYVEATTQTGNMYKLAGFAREGATSVDLNVRLAHAPWVEYIIWQKGADGQPLLLDGTPAQVTSIQQNGTELLIEIPYWRASGSRDDAEQVEIVLTDGRRLSGSDLLLPLSLLGRSGETGKDTLRFSCRPEQLFQVILSTRPYERITIPNVPLVMSAAKESEPAQ